MGGGVGVGIGSGAGDGAVVPVRVVPAKVAQVLGEQARAPAARVLAAARARAVLHVD